ncbi:MAG: N-acetyltransferase [Sphingomonas bacterium]|nr:GNAT family protein [Sphingomonas bacterium]MDB5690745.1 N-acetyltransferase [Sphingomonas bacterium]
MADPAALVSALGDGVVHLEPLAEEHREPLRAACAADPAIWQMYLISWFGEHFDATFDTAMNGENRAIFAAFAGGVLVGMTGYTVIVPAHAALEIGMTYLAPEARGTGINRRFKDLLLTNAFAAGFTRCEFRVDVRNTRSQAAMAKLGAVREGVLRKNQVTWKGHARDTAIYSILADEWPGKAAA